VTAAVRWPEMRVPSVRVVLAGLAAAAVFVGGSVVTRDGPLGGGGTESGGTARSATGSEAPAPSPPTLGSIDDQLARLPQAAPGDLAGVLDVATDDCSPDQVDLATLERTSKPTGICAAPGAKFGIRDDEVTDDQVIVRDLDGRLVETVAVPSGWFFNGLTRHGIVFCDDEGDDHAHGRLRRFLGTSKRLPSCPLTHTREGGLLFPSADRSSLIDERGHRVVTMAGRLPQVTNIGQMGDGLLAINTELYRDGRRIAAFGTEGVSILGASSDGSVALLRHDATGTLVVYHDGVPHEISRLLAEAGSNGVVAPDGKRILIQRHGDRSGAYVIDAATRRPIARLGIVAGDFVYDWRPADA